MRAWFQFLILSTSLFTFVSCTCSRQKEIADEAVESSTPKEFSKPDYSKIKLDQVIARDGVVGKGKPAKAGSKVTGRYKMWIYLPNEPGNKGPRVGGSEKDLEVTVTIGKGAAPKGFEDGLIGIKDGGFRTIIIPISLGYGEKGSGEVPPNSMLIVEFEATDVE